MNTIMKFKLNNEAVTITSNSVECKNTAIQIDLVKLLVDSREATQIGEDPLPHLFNTFLRFMNITNIEFIEVEQPVYMNVDVDFAEEILERIAA